MDCKFNEKTNHLLDDFIDFTDNIYWDGYAEDLALTNPEKFYFEFSEFLNNQ